MNRSLTALALAAALALLGAVPAIAAGQVKTAVPQGDSTATGSGDRISGLIVRGDKTVPTSGLAGTNDPATSMGIVLWSLVGGSALAAGATSVAVVRRRAKADAA